MGAWRGVATGGGSRACHRWARRKRQPPEGELLQWAPQIHHHLDHHLSHTFPCRTRPKKEDWLQKKEDPEERVSSRPGPLSLHEVRLSSVLGTASSLTLTLWLTLQQLQMTSRQLQQLPNNS